MTENPLLDKNICFHSIGGEVFRIESILKHGILSPSALSETGMPTSCMYGFGYNGTKKVSVFVSPLFCEADLLDHGYTKGIVFVCKADYSVHGVSSGIPSEAHVDWGISPDKITGIMLPESFWHAPISKYNKFMGGLGQLPDICNSFTKWMKSECDYQASDYKELLKKLKKEENVLKWDTIRDQIGKLVFGDLQKAIDKKLGKPNVTFADLVKYYTKDTNLILYHTEELESDETYLNRLKTKKIKSATQNVGYVNRDLTARNSDFREIEKIMLEELESAKTYLERLETEKIKSATQNVARNSDFREEKIMPKEAGTRSTIIKRFLDFLRNKKIKE